MSPSSKFVMQRGRHRTPAVCHPPPPPPPIIPPPPPVCPPTSIGGTIDAEFGSEPPYDEYYSPYTALPDPEEPTTYHQNTGPEYPFHEIDISLPTGGPNLTIDLMIWDEYGTDRYYFRNALPFTWCQHNNLTCSEWDEAPADHQTCVVNLQW